MRWIPLLFAVVACTSSSNEGGDAPVVDEADLTRTAGTAVKTSDGKLTAVIDMVDGVTTRTTNMRFVRAKVARANKTFSAWCEVDGETVGTKPTTRVVCEKIPMMGENDEWEDTLSFWFSKSASGTKLDIDYVNERGIFEDEGNILLGDPSSGQASNVPLTVVKQGTDAKRDPFVFADAVHSALKALVGQKLELDGGSLQTVTGYDFSISPRMEIYAKARFGSNQRTVKMMHGWVSILKTEGDLSSGIADATTILDRVKDSLAR